MVVVRCYNSETGHVEVVRKIDTQICDELDRVFAEQYIDSVVLEDHSTDHVYYIARVKS